jgi:hypothetical protein
MIQTLYIDANIYLRFYDSNSKEFKKLLKSIEEIKDNIFITSQIQNEVERNKLDVFVRSFIGYEKQFVLNNISLPEHLESTTDKELKDWNVATNELINNLNGQKKKLKGITEKLIENITDNKDEVSQTLIKIFSSSQSATVEQTARARNRKELGNPPGKNNDPLGDQISWEQLLDKTDAIAELWIISNDSDYIFEFNKKCHLNSYLINELKQKNSTIKINCFNTLSEGFTSFDKSRKISALPSEQELIEITSEEKKSNQLQNLFSNLTGPQAASGATDPSILFGTQGTQRLIANSGFSSIIGAQGVQGFIGYSTISPHRICQNCKKIYPSYEFKNSDGSDSIWCQECRDEKGDVY